MQKQIGSQSSKKYVFLAELAVGESIFSSNYLRGVWILHLPERKDVHCSLSKGWENANFALYIQIMQQRLSRLNMAVDPYQEVPRGAQTQ